MIKITQLAKSYQKALVEFLRDIIAIPSVSGQEGAVVERIKAEMESLGYREVRVDGLGNLLGIIGSGSRVIALDGHCDTVDVGSRDNWDCDPFNGKYENGIIYGRGASDQKGGLASALYAGKIVKETGLPADTSLLVVASVLEEDFEGLCWKYILEESGIKPEAVLLTEPSSLGIRFGQRGRMEIKVNTRGVSCHGSAPERGENAIYKIAPVILDIKGLNKQLHSDSILGKGSVTITDVRSSAPSLCAVPDRASLHLDRRLSEGETLESSLNEVLNLQSVKAADARVAVPEYQVQSYTGSVYPVNAYYPMWLMEKDHPLVECAKQAFRAQFAREPDTGVWKFSTNGVVTKGMFDIPTIGFGPGDEEYAHTPIDQVRELDLVKAMEFYAAFVLNWANRK